MRRRYSPTLSNCFLALACVSSGMFVSSTALLPSAFTMCALTAAAAGVLAGRVRAVILTAAAAVVWGWCVAGPAFLPYAAWVLAAGPLLPSVAALAVSLAGVLVPLVLVDRAFYGKWTVRTPAFPPFEPAAFGPLGRRAGRQRRGCAPLLTVQASLLNFLRYNVVGGGQSDLYGVEGPGYYLRNGLNQLQLVLPLALCLPLLAGAARLAGGAAGGKRGGGGGGGAGARGPDGLLLLCVSPVFVWLGAITALAHKEERFLYVVYPLVSASKQNNRPCFAECGGWAENILHERNRSSSLPQACLAAAASLDLLATLTRRVFRGELGARLARGGVAAALALTAVLSLSRSAALVAHYGAPMQVYRALPPDAAPRPGAADVAVCVGAEWHRFPSAFFLPGPQFRLRFIKSGFDGLLPRGFDPAQGGPAAAPPQLNDQNRDEPANYWATGERCDFAVTMLQSDGAGGWEALDAAALGPAGGWEVVAEAPFVDHGASPALARALYLPRLSAARNRWLRYVLLKRVT